MPAIRLFALTLWALLFAMPAAAHLTPNSEVRLDFGAQSVVAEIVIPLGEIGFALDRPIAGGDGALSPATRQAVRAYLAPRITARAADGRAWAVALDEPVVRTEAGPPDLHVRATMQPPAGASARRLTLAYSAVIDRIPNHFVLIVARSDFAAGHLSGDPEIVGGLQGRERSVLIDRGAGRAGRGFLAAIGLGMHHIAEGHDHLLFLITLLLPAPLIAIGSGLAARWGGSAPPRTVARRLAAIVTAFTVGHSLTLIGGAFLGWKLPAQPVEIGIALSILISAVHAARPLFAGREPMVAASFGLVHGLAFATLVDRIGIEPWQKAQAILGFNVGIEIVQLLVVMAVLPALLLLARTRAYPGFRLAMAGFSGVAAIAWIAERTLGTENPVARAIDGGLTHAPWVVAALTVLAGLLWACEHRQARAI